MYEYSMNTTEEPAGRVALVVGPAVAIGAAGLLKGVRGDVGTVNVALVLSCIVVVAALAGRAAGLATAVAAALAYNFFHTVPYYSLRISSGRDIVTVVLLVIIGVIVSEISAWRRRAQESSVRRLHGARALEATAAQLAAGRGPDEIWVGVRAALIELLGLADCRYEPGPSPSVQVLPPSGSLLGESMRLGSEGFEMPDEGAALAVSYAGRILGHIVLVPDGHSGSARDTRQVAIALADEFAVALASNQTS